MNRFLFFSFLISILISCSNTPELETGEIKLLAILDQEFKRPSQQKEFIDSRLLLTRKQIDEAKVPVLYVELPSGQNGTLTPYPGQGIGQTWLGADGAIITLDRGVLKASRGMGDDLMGSTSSMPPWPKIKDKEQNYIRELSYITGNNQISKIVFRCDIQKIGSGEVIEIWDINFTVNRLEENCLSDNFKTKNTYYLDDKGIVRKSFQYHSATKGYILIERLDR